MGRSDGTPDSPDPRVCLVGQTLDREAEEQARAAGTFEPATPRQCPFSWLSTATAFLFPATGQSTTAVDRPSPSQMALSVTAKHQSDCPSRTHGRAINASLARLFSHTNGVPLSKSRKPRNQISNDHVNGGVYKYTPNRGPDFEGTTRPLGFLTIFPRDWRHLGGPFMRDVARLANQKMANHSSAPLHHSSSPRF
jgi:hypothetical protein